MCTIQSCKLQFANTCKHWKPSKFKANFCILKNSVRHRLMWEKFFSWHTCSTSSFGWSHGHSTDAITHSFISVEESQHSISTASTTSTIYRSVLTLILLKCLKLLYMYSWVVKSGFMWSNGYFDVDFLGGSVTRLMQWNLPLWTDIWSWLNNRWHQQQLIELLIY